VGAYPEQFILTGIFLWLILWRVLNRYRLGTDLKALVLLAPGSFVLTALLEAVWYWSRRNFDIPGTIRSNFSLSTLEIGIPPAWQVLAFGVVFVFGAIASQALRSGTVAGPNASQA